MNDTLCSMNHHKLYAPVIVYIVQTPGLCAYFLVAHARPPKVFVQLI